MLIILKCLLLSILGGTVFQLLVYALFAALGIAGLSIIFLWGWILFAFDQQWPLSWATSIAKLVTVIAVDNLVYSTLIYFLLWHRDLTKERRRKPATQL